MKLTFLSAEKPLTKSYTLYSDGGYDSTPYPRSYELTSHEVEVDTIEDFYANIVANSQHGNCLLKGNLRRPIHNESRAGLMASEQTLWMLLDFDGLDPQGKSMDMILDALGVGGVDYIQQYSASQGIKEGLNAHVFMLLDTPHSAEELKMWIKWRNLEVPLLKSQLVLTKTNMALHWPLDITVCQNDKLLYIAPPTISGGKDPVKDRITLNLRGKRSAFLQAPPQNIDERASEAVSRLRKDLGLPDHKLTITYDEKASQEVMKSPDKASVTGVKHHGDFTYLNLNGGDSWGYWHRTDKPNILFNFKGEPAYRLKDICPDYYSEAQVYAKSRRYDAHRPSIDEDRPIKFVINKADEGKYYKVTYTPGEGASFSPAPTLRHIEDWCLLQHVPIPEAIDDWEVIFDPTITETMNAKDKILNTFKPTAYKVRSLKCNENNPSRYPTEILERGRECNDPPIEYFKLLHHICGNDAESTDRLVNWLAYIWQTGKRPGTAWVLHGTYGTGKGRFLLVLKHLFGEHCTAISPEALEDKFTEHLEKAQIVWLDEITDDAWDSDQMTPKLRALIDGEVASRRMRKAWTNMELYFGLFIAANEHNPVMIRFGDRRFNVAPRQEKPLNRLPWATDEVLDRDQGILYQESNLQAFADYLINYPVDRSKVIRPMENEAKLRVMKVTQNLPEDIVQALELGDVGFFLDFVSHPDSLPSADAVNYKAIVSQMIEGGKVGLKNEEIRHIFSHLAGWQQAAGKFNKAVAKFGLHLSGRQIRRDNSTLSGTYFEFKPTEKDKELWKELNAKKQPLTVVRSNEQAA